jgi:hypothetical protein
MGMDALCRFINAIGGRVRFTWVRPSMLIGNFIASASSSRFPTRIALGNYETIGLSPDRFGFVHQLCPL